MSNADHFAIGQQPIVACDRTDIIRAGDVGGGKDMHDTFASPDGRQVHGPDAGMGMGALAKSQMEHVDRFRPVIGIAGRARDMERRAVMRV